MKSCYFSVVSASHLLLLKAAATTQRNRSDLAEARADISSHSYNWKAENVHISPVELSYTFRLGNLYVYDFNITWSKLIHSFLQYSKDILKNKLY